MVHINSLLKSQINLYDEISKLVSSAQDDVIIISPYIRSNALKKLLSKRNDNSMITIITTWKPADVAFGSSDLKVYDYCKANSWPLLINNRIHLKTILIDDMSRAYIGSANISNTGLSISKNPNYEIGSIIEDLSIDDKNYFDKIIQKAFMVDESYYEKIKSKSSELSKPEYNDEFDVTIRSDQKDFLLSSLPMSLSPENFILGYFKYESSGFDDEDKRSFLHDKRLYEIGEGLNDETLNNQLRDNFLSHPFIIEFLEYVADGKYFGELSSWLHDRVTTVPTPRRYEIKDALKRIYAFVNYLSDEYRIVITHRRSQKLEKIKH